MSLHAHTFDSADQTALSAPLSDQDRLMLDTEARWWTQPVAKADLVREQLGMDLSAYELRLQDLVNNPASLDYDPLLIRRLRRLAARPRRSAR
jgi:hypothetical protein